MKIMLRLNPKIQKQSEEKIYIFSKLHHGHYVSAYNLFVEKPIFGNGVNSFRNKCKKYDHEFNCSTHPHNFFLQILSELGLVGSLFYIFCLLSYKKYPILKNS